MANILKATVYSYQNNPDYAPDGIEIGFPVSKIIIKPLSPTLYFNGHECLSTIEIITANTPFPIYYVANEAIDLITTANS